MMIPNNSMSECVFCALSRETTAAQLGVDLEKGLRSAEAKQRLQQAGPNQLKEKKGIGPLAIFIEQFKGFIIWVLIGAALISGFLQEWIDAAAIIAIIVLNSILGFIQEYRAERSLAALKKLSSPSSKVIRDGVRQIIPSAELIPGDLIELEAGDNVPADARLTYLTPNFSTQEASLTGESVPVAKTILPLAEKAVPLAERANMVYLGTSVASGKARAIVVGTGMRTELGRIAGMIQEIEEDATPLQKKLAEFGKWIVYLCVVLVAVVFLLEWWRGGELLTVFITAVSLAVAAIPEGLPAVVTIALALGVQRMVRRHALIRKLPSVETLGSATVICSDKTGTLTKNEMAVRETYVEPGREALFLKTLVLCNGAELVDGRILGDPTEGALLVAAAKSGIHKREMEVKYPFIEEIPFDSERKLMTIVRRDGDKFVAFIKGAPDLLLTRCLMDDEKREKILAANDELAGKALRVLAAAYRELPGEPAKYSPEEIEKDLTFLGLAGMIDPPREEARAAIAKCHTAGIKVVMITGDHRNTAEAIGRELGVDSVYARVSPEDKLRIITGLRKRGEVVAMTGDGVNDAPALKEADIGVAMGITGTDVSKEVADMVITDDNFASIVAAVEEGRGIYDNIRKFVHYLLSCNAGEILVMLVASLIGWPIPLLPIQILWVNLVTDGLPALALGVDPVDPDIMKKPPRPTNEPVITARRAWLMLAQGAFIAFCSLLAFAFVLYYEGEGIGRARTAAFIVLATTQLFHSFNCRSQERSLFRLGLFSNMSLIYAALISFALLIAVVYLPFFQLIFKTINLSFFDWLMVLVASSLPLWAMEMIKLKYHGS